jgi:Mce-associated membrane protein
MTDQLLIENTSESPDEEGPARQERTPKSKFKATTSKAGTVKPNGVKVGAVKANAVKANGVKANGVKANGVKANVSGSKAAKERTPPLSGMVAGTDTEFDLDPPVTMASLADDHTVVADLSTTDQSFDDDVLSVETGTDDADRQASPWPGRVGRWTRTHAAPVITGFVAVALAVALALTLMALGNRNAVGQARTSALAAGRTYAAELAGYNYRTLGHDFGLVLSHSTPAFRHSFTQTSNALRKTLTQYHATSTAKVVSAGVVSATPSRASVLVFLDQTVTNTNAKKPSTDRSQVVLNLLKPHGSKTWLINDVTLL